MGRARLAQGPPEEALNSGWPSLGAGPPHLPQACSGQAIRALCLLSTPSCHLSWARPGKDTLTNQEHGVTLGIQGQGGLGWAGVSEPNSGLCASISSSMGWRGPDGPHRTDGGLHARTVMGVLTT